MNLAYTYARALYETAEKAGKRPSKELFKNFTAALKRRGHERLLPRILTEYEKLAGRGRAVVRVRIAREKDRSAALKATADMAATAPSHDIALDPTLVSGFTITGPDFRYDASGRRALIDLYKRLIATR